MNLFPGERVLPRRGGVRPTRWQGYFIRQACSAEPELPQVDIKKNQDIIDRSADGYLPRKPSRGSWMHAGSPGQGSSVTSIEDATRSAAQLGFPVVMKVVGPVHNQMWAVWS